MSDRAGYLLATLPAKSEQSQERVTEQQQSCPNMRPPLLQCEQVLFHLQNVNFGGWVSSGPLTNMITTRVLVNHLSWLANRKKGNTFVYAILYIIMRGTYTPTCCTYLCLKGRQVFKTGRILDRTTRWGISDIRHKSSGLVTETGALPPGWSNINVSGDSGTHGPSC